MPYTPEEGDEGIQLVLAALRDGTPLPFAHDASYVSPAIGTAMTPGAQDG